MVPALALAALTTIAATPDAGANANANANVAVADAGTSPTTAPTAACIPIAGNVTVTPIAPMPDRLGPSFQELHAVWTGTEVLLYGTWQEERLSAPPLEPTGLFAWSPTANTWRRVKPSSAISMRKSSLVWVAGRAVLWGGVVGSGITNAGAIIDPATGTVTPITPKDAPSPRHLHGAVAVGQRMFVFGGGGMGKLPGGWSCDGGLFDPAHNTWSAIAPLPDELCPLTSNAHVVAGSAERAALVFATIEQRPRIRVGFYDVAKRTWTIGPSFDPGRVVTFWHDGAFGPNGALYLVGNENYSRDAGTLFRVDPHDAHVEELRSVCTPGTPVWTGDRLRIFGPNGSCELDDLSSRSCRFATRSVGMPGTGAPQVELAFGDGLFVWGHGSGSWLHWNAPSTVNEEGTANVRGAAIDLAGGWCGGATPPPWTLTPPQTVAKNAQLLVRKGDHNTHAKGTVEVQSDADGLFDVQLPPGAYCVIGPSQKTLPFKVAPKTDPSLAQCLSAEYEKCLATFDVPAQGRAGVIVRIPHPCRGPCFRGPPPP